MQSQQDQDRINRNVNELSAKLLEGCKLLSDSCPDTNVPLVLTKDGRMFSVGTNAYYRRDDTGALVRDTSVPPPSSGAGVPVSCAARQITYPPPPPQQAAEPAMHAYTIAAPPPAAPLPQAAYTYTAGTGGATNLSSQVAQRLLEGWQLMPESCPETNVPLVQSRDGQIQSVGTGKFFVRDAGGALRELPPRALPAAATPAPGSVGPLPAGASVSGASQSAGPSPQRGALGGSGAYSVGRQYVGAGAPRRAQVVNSTLDALYAKLDAAQVALVAAPPDLVSGNRQLVVSIQEIAAAIAAVQALTSQPQAIQASVAPSGLG